MTLLDRYLSLELTFPFLVGLAGFILIEIGTVLFNGLIDVMLQSHTPPGLVIQILILKLPVFIVQALPIALLFGVSLGMNRLARENEINAIRLSGVPLRRILLPLLAVGLAVAALDYAVEEKVAPAASTRAESLIQRMWAQSSLPQIQADIFFHAGDRWFYIGSVEKTGENRYLLRRLMIYTLNPGGYPTLTVADRAVTDGVNWWFRDWRSIDPISQHERTYLGSARVGTLHLNLHLDQFMFEQHRADDMSAAELGSMIHRFALGGVKVPSLVIQYQTRFSVPAGCLVVVLISMPLAVHFARSGSFMGILLSIVVWFFYFNTFFLARLLGSQGLLPPLIAAWAHNAIFAVAGLVMLWREE